MKALRLATKVAGFVNTEFKYYENESMGNIITYNGVIFPNLCIPAQGVTVNQREGDSIKAKTMTMQGTVLLNSTAVEIVRIIVFVDKMNTITTPTQFWEDIGSTLSVLSNKNQDNKYNTKILCDKSFTVDTYHPLHKFKFVCKIDRHIHFTAGTTTITDNDIKMFVIGQTVTNGSFFSYHSHISYVDN